MRCIRSVSASRGAGSRGVDERELPVGPFATPVMRRRVVCGLSDAIAIFVPQSTFTSVDLPTFGLRDRDEHDLTSSQGEGLGQELGQGQRADLAGVLEDDAVGAELEGIAGSRRRARP